VLVSAYDEQSRLRAVLNSADDEFHQWATDVYETVREETTRLKTILSTE